MPGQFVKAAMERFEIPEEYEHFLFVMPAFYVAKADGKISTSETISIVRNSILFNLVDTITDKGEKDSFLSFAHRKILTFSGKSNLDDLSVVVKAINEKLGTYPDDEQGRIRTRIRELCMKVAQSSGPLFKDKVSKEEAAMLDQILEGV